MPHLTATTILGASTSERDTVGQLCATQIASAIVTKHPEETRLLVVGMGLRKDQLTSEHSSQMFMDLLEAILKMV